MTSLLWLGLGIALTLAVTIPVIVGLRRKHRNACRRLDNTDELRRQRDEAQSRLDIVRQMAESLDKELTAIHEKRVAERAELISRLEQIHKDLQNYSREFEHRLCDTDPW